MKAGIEICRPDTLLENEIVGEIGGGDVRAGWRKLPPLMRSPLLGPRTNDWPRYF